MQFVLISILISLSQLAFGAQDSLGVFHRPEKVVVLINESPSQGTRLKDFIRNYGSDEGFEWLTEDETIRIYCAYNSEMSSCTFKMLPSSLVTIGKKSISAKFPFNKEDFTMSFESSMKDKFNLVIKDQELSLEASKR